MCGLTEFQIHDFDELDSTGLHARREVAEGRLSDFPVAFTARRQTAGVGRLGRSWESPEGGLWMTACWPMPRDRYLAVVDGLGLRVGVACRAAIERVMLNAGSTSRVLLKWPNDVLIEGRKVLGALTEIVTVADKAWILVGVGANVRVACDALPPGVRDLAGSLHVFSDSPIGLTDVRDQLLASLSETVPQEGLSYELLEEARANLAALGTRVLVSMADGTKVVGTLIGLNEQGMGMFEIDGRLYVPPIGSSLVLDPATHDELN